VKIRGRFSEPLPRLRPRPLRRSIAGDARIMKTKMLLTCCAVFAVCLCGCAPESFTPSPYTVDEGVKMLSPQMRTGEFKRRIQTTPILTSSNVFHWVMNDGHIWTTFENSGAGDPIIVRSQSEKDGQKSRQPPPEVLRYLRRLMEFSEAPSQHSFDAIIAEHVEVLQWLKTGEPMEVEHNERIFKIFLAFVWKKFSYSGAPISENEMEHIFNSLRTLQISSPSDLDQLWAAFFATGEERYLDSLFSAATSSDMMIAGAAKWSLNSNYRQLEAVRKYFDERPDKKTGLIR
jgi:hypothetical protein